MRKQVLVLCTGCGISFKKCAWRAKRTSKHYCTRYCRFHHEKSRAWVKVVCKCCGVSFEKKTLEVQKTTNNFCSSSCAAKYAHRNRTKVISHSCFCGKKKPNHRTTFCSIRCANSYAKQQLTEQWLKGLISGNNRAGRPRTFVKEYLISIRGERCESCGWEDRHPITGKVPIQLDHIDGNYKNTVVANLRLLCPNHHSLTNTYMGLNKGRGRSKKTQPLFGKNKKVDVSCVQCTMVFKRPYLVQKRRPRKYCSAACARLASKLKRTRPSAELLKELIRTKSILQIARQYNVSDNAIRKWAKQYGLYTNATHAP